MVGDVSLQDPQSAASPRPALPPFSCVSFPRFERNGASSVRVFLVTHILASQRPGLTSREVEAMGAGTCLHQARQGEGHMAAGQ